MKGFPNQITDIGKLTTALSILSGLIAREESVDDDAFGERLLRQGVIKPGNRSASIDRYLEATRRKPPSNQSHRTTARGVKEFFRKAGLIRDTDDGLQVTDAGSRLAAAVGQPTILRESWRDAARNIVAVDNAGNTSHPYQILLRMLAARPGTPRAFCALALEALDDSEEELQRIIALRDGGDEAAIRSLLGVSQSNWDNAKKILPSIAEQLGDVARNQDGLHLVNAGVDATSTAATGTQSRRIAARRVTPDTIATTREPDDSDEVVPGNEATAVSMAEAIAKRAERSYRHNRLVQRFVAELSSDDNEFWEGNIDCLVVNPAVAIMAEMKTLDGSEPDEMHQIRNAVAQLLYYERFALPPEIAGRLPELELVKAVVLESAPADTHTAWVESLGIRVVWMTDTGLTGSDAARDALLPYVRFNP